MLVYWQTPLWHIIHLVYTQPAHNVPGTSPEGPLKALTFGTYKGLSRDLEGTNTKIDDLIKKLSFWSDSPCITYLLLLFTGRTNIQMFQTGTSKGCVRDVVEGNPGDQIMRRFRNFRGMSVEHVFKIQLTSISNLLWLATQDFIVNGSSKNLI